MLKLIGVDTSFKAPSIIDQPVINAQDFSGEGFGIIARANQAALEAVKNQIINQSSTDLSFTNRRSYAGSGSSSFDAGGSGGGSGDDRGSGRGSSGGRVFDPNLDVSEREKWEFEKQQDLAKLQLDAEKFGITSNLDERKFQRGIVEDERDFERDVYEDERDFATGREDRAFDERLKTAEFGLDVDKFDYTKAKDTQERQDKLYEKAKAEFQAQQYAMATQDVQELILASEGLMRQGGGLEAIRGGLSSIFRKYPGIAPEKQTELIQNVYATPQRVNREQIQKTEAKIEEVQQFQRNTVLQAKRVELQGLTAGLKTATGSRRSQLLNNLTAKLNQFASSDGDPLTKAMVMSNLYQEIATKGEVGADVQQKLLDYAQYTKDASQLYMMRNKMSPSAYKLQESMLQQKYGVQGERLNDINYDSKVALEGLKTTTDLTELKTKNLIDQRYGLNASRASIAQMAKAHADPARLEALKATAARYGNPPGLAQAVKLAEDLYNHRSKTVKVQQEVSKLEQEQVMLQASDAKSVLDMLEGNNFENNQNLITTAMLAQANPKLAELLQNKQKIPPEMRNQIINQWKDLRQRAVNEINIQKRQLMMQHQLERDYLNSYFSKDNFAALDNINAQMPQLRAQLNAQRSQIGVSRSNDNIMGQIAAQAQRTLQEASMGGMNQQPMRNSSPAAQNPDLRQMASDAFNGDNPNQDLMDEARRTFDQGNAQNANRNAAQFSNQVRGTRPIQGNYLRQQPGTFQSSWQQANPVQAQPFRR